MSHFSRVPMNLLYPELYKSDTTNYNGVDDVPSVKLDPSFRAPAHAEYRDQLFRRYPDGALDLPNAILLVLEVVYKAKAGSPLNEQECLIMSCCFPHAAEGRVPQFDGHAAKGEARSRFRLSDAEVRAVSMGVAHTLAASHEHALFGFKG